MNENHRIQDSISFCGEENSNMIRVAMENGAIGAKLAGAGGGGTIVALTQDPARTKEALKKAGVKEFVELNPYCNGVTSTFIRGQIDELLK